MKKSLALGSALLCASALGCHVQHTSANSGPVDVDVRAQVEAELEIGNELSGVGNETKIFWFFTRGASTYSDGVLYSMKDRSEISMMLGLFGDSYTNVKAGAVFNALAGSGADVLIDPRYVIDVDDYGIVKFIRAEVRGRAAKVKGYHQVPLH